MATKTMSNAERKRLARAKLLVEQQRIQKAKEGSITPFRVEELYWKDRIEEPNWNLAFHARSEGLHWDSRTAQDSQAGYEAGRWTDRNGAAWIVQKWNLANNRTAYCFPENPGALFARNS